MQSIRSRVLPLSLLTLACFAGQILPACGPITSTASAAQPAAQQVATLALGAEELPAGGSQDRPAWTQAELEAMSLVIQGEVEKLRGEKFDGIVKVKLSNKEQFVQHALERTEHMDPAPKRAEDEMIQKMLGLIPHDMDLLEETLRLLQDQVGGFYDPTSKTFYLMENCPEGIAKVVLSHELGHALDDQLYDIDGTLSKVMERSDMGMAYQAVVEGSGTAIMNRWTVKNIKELDLSGLANMQEEQSASMARSPMILWKPLLGAYLTGAAFLARTDSIFGGQTKSATNKDLDQAFRFPPKSTEQILHPEKYWDPAQRDEPIAVAQNITDLPEGWSVLRRDVAGELVMGIWALVPSSRTTVDPAVFSNPLGVEFTSPVVEGRAASRSLSALCGRSAPMARSSTVATETGSASMSSRSFSAAASRPPAVSI
jgi:hypothetical protein